MRIAVCDDDQLFLKVIAEQLRQVSEVRELSVYSELNTFLHSVDSGEKYHAVLMDIDWGQEKDGMKTAEYLYRKCPDTKIIYVTGYNDRFSQDIFLHKSNLSGYLTKPVDPARLRANLEKVICSLRTGKESVLALRAEGGFVSVPVKEIYYIESIGHNIVVHTKKENITNYRRLEHIAQQLPASFFQCHKSYLINLDQVQRLQSASIVLKNGESVPVSRSRYRQTREAYIRFIGRSF